MSTLKTMYEPSVESHLPGEEPADATTVLRGQALYRGAGVAAFVQLACTFMTIMVVITLGGEPTTAEEYFTVLQQDRLVGILRMDLPSLLNVILFTVTAFAIYGVLRQVDDLYPALATALIFTGVAISVATHSAFSLIHLSEQYALATTDLQRSHLLAAGEAIIASDWWHSTGGAMAGIFLQGGMVLLSFVMLRSSHFSKGTAYTGMVANGLDWVHILVGLFLPTLGAILLSIGGLFYLAWYPLLGRDLFRLGQSAARETVE